LAEDTDAALEWIDYQASLCSGCGLPRHETMARANEERYDVERIVCHACKVQGSRARADAESENTDTAGMFYAIIDERE
jgi:hypothetical protein